MEKVTKIFWITGGIIWIIAIVIFVIMLGGELEVYMACIFAFMFVLGSVFIAIADMMGRKKRWNEADELQRLEMKRMDEEQRRKAAENRLWRDSFGLILSVILILIAIILGKLT